VITEDEATRLLRRADPARFEARAPIVEAAGYLADLRTRSTTVTLTQTQPTDTDPSPGGRHRWPIIALAAAAVVLIVVGALVVAARDDDNTTVPADTTLTPEQPASAEDVVQGYIDAQAAYDADLALTYLADDVVTSWYGSADAYRRGMAWDEAARFKTIISDCAPRDGGTGGDVTFACSVVVDPLGSGVLGNGEYRRPELLLTVRDGKIVAQSQADADWGSTGIDVIGPFTGWVRNTHPEDMAVMFQADGQTPWFEKSTDESLSLWSERADEFVQAVLDARETYHADVAAICANQAEQLAQLAAPAEDAAALAAWSASAAAILQQAHDDLTALTTPLVTDTTAYARFYGNLIRLARNLQDSADAVTAAGSTQQDELRAEYLDIRSSMSSGPQGSGLEQCVASLPS
jgi:hypothetical protein